MRIDALLDASRVSATVRTLRGGGKAAELDFRLHASWSMHWLGGAGGTATAPGVACGGGELRTGDVGGDDLEEAFPVSAVVLRAPRDATPALAEVVAAARELAGGALAGLLRAALRKLPAWLVALDSTPEAEAEAAAADAARRAAAEAREARTAAVLAPQRVVDAPGGGGGAEAGAVAAAAVEAATPAPPPAAPPAAPSVRALPLLAAADAMVASAGSGAVALPVAPHRVTPAGEAPAVAASKWNKGGWGYEEMDVTPWAVAHLKALLNGFHVDLPGGHVRIVEVDSIKGEAAKILRKVRLRGGSLPTPLGRGSLSRGVGWRRRLPTPPAPLYPPAHSNAAATRRAAPSLVGRPFLRLRTPPPPPLIPLPPLTRIYASQGGTIVVFDFSFVASWEGALVDPATGAQRGTGDGAIEVTDLDQDAFSVARVNAGVGTGGGGGGGGEGRLELPLRVRASDDGGAMDHELARKLEEFGAPLLRARLARFCAELKAQEVDGLHA